MLNSVIVKPNHPPNLTSTKTRIKTTNEAMIVTITDAPNLTSTKTRIKTTTIKQ